MLMLRSRAEPVKDSLRRAPVGACLTEPARPQKRISREEAKEASRRISPENLHRLWNILRGQIKLLYQLQDDPTRGR